MAFRHLGLKVVDAVEQGAFLTLDAQLELAVFLSQ